jgi:hypothetical protein
VIDDSLLDVGYIARVDKITCSASHRHFEHASLGNTGRSIE